MRDQLLAADPAATLAGLYNALSAVRDSRDAAQPAYALLVAQERLDAAVAAAYGWNCPLSDDEILAQMLVLNLDRHAAETAGGPAAVAAP